MTDHSMDTSRVQPSKPISIIDVTHRNMHEGITYRNKSGSEIAISPKPTTASVRTHRSWEPGKHCIACRQPKRKIGKGCKLKIK